MLIGGSERGRVRAEVRLFPFLFLALSESGYSGWVYPVLSFYLGYPDSECGDKLTGTG